MKTLLAAAILSPSIAAAAPFCAPRMQLVSALSMHHGEEIRGGGLQGETSWFEVWTSEEEGSWSIVMSRADGISCVMASGTDWRDAGLDTLVRRAELRRAELRWAELGRARLVRPGFSVIRARCATRRDPCRTT